MQIGSLTRKLIGCLLACMMPLLLCAAVSLEEDTIEGVVVALKEKHPPSEETDEINGVVIADPCPISPTVCQVRVCTSNQQFINVVAPCNVNDLKESGFEPGFQIICKGNQTFPGYVSCPRENIRAKPPQNKIYPLSQAISCGVVSNVGLRGDGATTMSCQMPCTNTSSQDINVCVPRGQCFAPNQPGYQNMACTQDVICKIPAGQTVSVPLTTMCMSGKTLKPPPATGVQFNPGTFEPSDQKLADRLITATNILNSDSYYNHLPPGDERPKLIAQMAHWINEGKKSSNPADSVSPESIRDDMLSKTKLTYDSLPSKDQKTIDAMCSQIFKASNKTLNLAQSPQMDGLLAGAFIR
jgi:hypothetical protein